MANSADEATWQRVVVGGAAAFGGIATIGWSLWYLAPVSVISDGKAEAAWGASDKWQALAMLAVAVGIAFGVAALLRFALAPLLPRPDPPSAVSTEADTALRSRIAPIVLSIGSLAIVVLAVSLIVAFVVLSTGPLKVGAVSEKVDTLLTGVFATVLPVVATWVGTVLAFYFGSENFRQAAQSTRDALSDRLTPTRKITDVMIPAERIARLDANSPADVEKELMEEVIHMMSEAATRVIIFNKATQEPIYVIRSSVPPMPENWITGDYKKGAGITNQTIQDYLDFPGKKNRDDAQNFRFIDENATPEAALALMAREQVDDLFITKDGKKGRVLGWVATHDLRPR